MTDIQRKAERFREGNLYAAAVVLADLEAFGGEESLMVRWARMVLSPERSRPEIGRPA